MSYYVEDLTGEGVSGYVSPPFETEEEARAHAQEVEPSLYETYIENGVELHIIRDHDWDSGDCGIVAAYGSGGVTEFYCLIKEDDFIHRLDKDGRIVKSCRWGHEEELENLETEGIDVEREKRRMECVDDLRDQYDDDAVFGDIAVQAILGAVADGVDPGATDGEIIDTIKSQVCAIECNLEEYITSHFKDMIENIREIAKQ